MRAYFNVLCLCLACSSTFAQKPHFDVSIDCCTVLNELYKYMAVDDKYKCTSPDTRCASLKLMQLFVNTSATTMLAAKQQGSDIVFSLPDGVELASLLVYAFFGRSVSPAAGTEMQMWLSYDTNINRIKFEDSPCNFNKNVYTTLVLSSVILLMFFIAVQVVSDEKANKKTEVQQKASEAIAFPKSEHGVLTQRRDTQLIFRPVSHTSSLRFTM
jgi:hypothetical protein